MTLRRITGRHPLAERALVALNVAAFAALLAGVALDALAQGPNARRARAPSDAETREARAPRDDQIALNFKDAEIDTVIAAFGHLLNRTFLVDPRVRGRVTLETPRPVSRARAYELLQASLRVQGFAIVESAGLSRVVPEADAKLQAGPVTSGRPERTGDQVVTQVFRLRYESATNLVPVLRPLITANNTVTAYPANNSLVITDYAANVQRLGRIIASLDSPSTSEIEVVPVKHAHAGELAITVARMLDDATRVVQGAQVDPGQRVSVLADPRLNSIMIRSASPAKMNLAKSVIARLDQPSSEPGNIHVVYLRNAEAVRLAQVLRGVLAGDAGAAGGPGVSTLGGAAPGLGGTPGSGLNTGAAGQPQGLGGMAPGAQQAALGGATSTGAAGATDTRGTTFAAGGAIIAADPATNSLIVTAPEPVFRNIRSVIERLDARRVQVFIESLIVEITAERAAELGVQWQFLNGLTSTNQSRVFGGTNLPAPGTGANILDLTTNPLAAAQGLNLGVIKGAITVGGQTIFNIGLLARALETQANANILATPNLLTLDNEEARIIIGQNVPFITGQFTSTATTGGAVNPFQTIERRDVGTALRVRPQVSESGSVRMQIFQETSDVLRDSAQGLITSRRAIESNVLVDDGQIVVLGGLIQDKVTGSVQKVPGLGDMPVVGQLFRYDARRREKTNLLVFLRPIVLRDANASHAVTGDRYDYMRQFQGNSRMPEHWALPDFPPADLVPMPAPPGQGAPGDGPASLSPDVDAAAAAARPAPVEESVPTVTRTAP